jgi:hypothetical protein
MSRQSKNARNLSRARDITKMHKNGEKGPKQTTPKHGKKWTYRHNPTAMKALAEFVKGLSGKQEEANEKTSGKAILRKAGGASKMDIDPNDD